MEAVATIAFALAGVIEGARKRLDAVGICVLAGLAAFGGGTVRDIVCNEIPSAFSDRRPYAVCSFAGGWVLVGGQAMGWSPGVALAAAVATATLARVAALVTGWSLPAWGAGDEPRGRS